MNSAGSNRARVFIVGSINMDLVMEVAAPPIAGQTVAGGDLRFIPGGKGANQACAAAKMGATTLMIGQVGSDPFAPMLLDSLRHAGVDTSRTGQYEGPSGCASIYVMPRGENCIVISPGANASVTPDHALSRLKDLTPADFVLLQLEIPLETVEAVLRHARARRATTILDPAPARSLDPALLKMANYLTPNQTEAAALSGTPDIREAGRRILRQGPDNLILKLGEKGCILMGAVGEATLPAHAVEAVDTTAAGDVFNGAFASALAWGEPPLSALAWANAAAAISVTRRGAQPSIPSRDETGRFLANPREI
jgi:ribokinase